MSLNARTEIDRLAHVLVHRPGNEIENMTPSLMEEQLFDDVVYMKTAIKEHDLFTNLMRAHGIQVTDFRELLVEALSQDADKNAALLDLVTAVHSVPPGAKTTLNALSPEALAGVLIEGLRADSQHPEHLFDLSPLPNLLFSRDAQVVIGEQVMFSSMKNDARIRESLLSSFAFQNAPSLGQPRVLADLSAARLQSRTNVYGATTIEGGDVLLFERGTCLVGMSERTSKQGIFALRKLLARDPHFKHLIVVLMPENRAQMHLDTILTRISKDEVLMYSPMIMPGGAQSLGALAYAIDGDDDAGNARYFESPLEALAAVGIDLNPVYCGGKDSFITQSREQWTDGANAFALSDGVICLYDRNVHTLEELDRNGYDIVHADQLDLKQQHALPTRKTAFAFPSHELSRARGGPRCMTMPLRRVSA
ncbi:MAG: arginine deiminase family protein [Gammaproteobacteria bacterium]